MEPEKSMAKEVCANHILKAKGMTSMKLLLLLIGMVMIVEGLPYVAAPDKMKDWLQKISELEPNLLRGIGLGCMLGGLLVCWLVLGSGFFEN